MRAIRQIDYPNKGGAGKGPNPRVETGAVQFGDDWPGYFIRGDDALHFCKVIDILINKAEASPQDSLFNLQVAQLKNLQEDIQKNTLGRENA